MTTNNIAYSHKSSNNITKVPDFMVPDKGLIAITGASGSGKSTCLDIISGFSPPSFGTLFYSPHFNEEKEDPARNQANEPVHPFLE